MGLLDWLRPKVQDDPSVMAMRELARDNSNFYETFGRHYFSQTHAAADTPLDIYGFEPTRNTAVLFAALMRCVTLISGTCAQLVCTGGLRVVDRDGKWVKTRRTKKICDVIMETPDEGETSGYSFLEDCVADYCLDGNNLVVPRWGMMGDLMGLDRYRPWDAYTVFSGGRRYYHLLHVDDRGEGLIYASARDVAHFRWPRVLRYGLTNASREGFAVSPVVALKNAIDIGIRGDKFVVTKLRRASKTDLHVNYEVNPELDSLSPEDRLDLAMELGAANDSGEPIVTHGADAQILERNMRDDMDNRRREFQVQECARYYGLPLPLLSVTIQQWGAAVNEQISKLGYKWGVKLHLDRLLGAWSLRLLQRGERFIVNPLALLQGDAEGIKDFVAMLMGNAQTPPVGTREEAREYVGLDKEPEGEYIETVQEDSMSKNGSMNGSAKALKNVGVDVGE